MHGLSSGQDQFETMTLESCRRLTKQSENLQQVGGRKESRPDSKPD